MKNLRRLDLANLILAVLLCYVGLITLVKGRISRWGASEATGIGARLIGGALVIMAVAVFTDWLRRRRH